MAVQPVRASRGFGDRGNQERRTRSPGAIRRSAATAVAVAARRPPTPMFSRVGNRRLWACAEHGLIYSAPDDGTAYGTITCPECGEQLLRYPPPEQGVDRIFWLCSTNPDHQGWDEAA